MAYTVIVTYEDGKTKRIEAEGRARAHFLAEQFALPLRAFDFGETEGRDVELVDSKGIRLLDASIPRGAEWALAWRDAKRTWARGYLTREEAEARMAELPKDSGAVILRAHQPLPWGQEPTQAALKPRKRRDGGNRTHGKTG